MLFKFRYIIDIIDIIDIVDHECISLLLFILRSKTIDICEHKALLKVIRAIYNYFDFIQALSKAVQPELSLFHVQQSSQLFF